MPFALHLLKPAEQEPPQPELLLDHRERPLSRLLSSASVVDERGSGRLEHQPNAAVPRTASDLHPHDPRASGRG